MGWARAARFVAVSSSARPGPALLQAAAPAVARRRRTNRTSTRAATTPARHQDTRAACPESSCRLSPLSQTGYVADARQNPWRQKSTTSRPRTSGPSRHGHAGRPLARARSELLLEATPRPMTGSPNSVTPAAVSAVMISVSVLRCSRCRPVSKSRIVARAPTHALPAGPGSSAAWHAPRGTAAA
jgi:hypothetical protein